ncbi:MAG: Lhr family helicase [Candidatus Binataceae bacterium]
MALLDGFHPAVRTWFERRFKSPSRVQELGWPVIGASQNAPGYDVLLCAPTGSGKTLAAFMWAINRLVVESVAGELRDEVSVLYVSPLKALANDIRLNLQEPLEGVQAIAAETLAKSTAGRGEKSRPRRAHESSVIGQIRAGLRTGDTSVSERARMLRRSPHILVTTPESLFILLTSARFREKLRAVRYVIVDELHALAGNKRGVHLSLTLERLERMVRQAGGSRPTRIGLSATLNPIETLAHFLAGNLLEPNSANAVRNPAGDSPSVISSMPRPVRIVRADDEARQIDLEVLAPGPELGSLATHPHWEAMYDAVASLVRAHRTTLVFTLSRRWAERIALALQKRLGNDAVMAHHGSLARAERLMAEQRLKRGELKAIVATASLELGIDVGAVELVCQIDSPKSIAASVQRVGRSGHSLGETPKGRFFALTLDDLIECAAAVHAIRNKRLDEVEMPSGCADVVAQQIVAIAAEEEDIGVDELFAILKSAFNFATLTSAQLEHLLEQMATARRERIQGSAPKIFYDRVARRVRPRRGARLAVITSGGTIPESGNLDVVINSEQRRIGDVEEDFAQESSRGDIFSLGSMPWRILGISKNRLLVEPAPGMAPSLPFWQAEAAGRSPALSAEACAIKRHIAALLRRPDGAKTAARWLIRECALEEHAALQAVAYVRRGVEALGAVPDERTLVVERFFDGLGGTQIVIHSPLGIRLNRGLGLALRKRLCQSFDFEIQASAIDDAVLLALNSRHSFPLEHLMTMLNSRNAREVLVQALLDAPMFEVRFRHVATRALSVMRSMQGRKVAAWIQRLRTQELITSLFPARNACFENRPPTVEVPDHFIVAETIRECLEESTDLKRLLKLLQGIEAGRVRTVLVDALAPSVFAHRVLLAWDYSFLDDGERANRRSRTVAMNPSMAEDVFREEGVAAMLSSEALQQVAGEACGRAPNSRARNADELYEMVRAHGSIRMSEVAEHVSGDAATILGELTAQGRIFKALANSSLETLIAAEDSEIYAAAYPEGYFEDNREAKSATVAPPPGEARIEIVRRTLATSAPLAVGEIVSRLGLSEIEVRQGLARLETAGTVFRGHFRTDTENPDQAEQWGDRYVLERIHRQTLNRLRAEVEPCDDREFAAFRLNWQRLSEPAVGSDGVRDVLEQLSGLAFAPDFWEKAILPARIPSYRPEYLDLLCMSGEIVWMAAPATEESPGALSSLPSSVIFVPRRQVAVHGDDLALDERERAVLEALTAAGAQFLDQLAEVADMSERDALAALWRLVVARKVTNDSFAPLRLLWSESAAITRAREHNGHGRHDAAVQARLKSSLSGRWSAIRSVAADSGTAQANPADEVKEFAHTLLRRHGIVAREMLAQENSALTWRELLMVLRRMEYAGTLRRGYFVRSLSGEQYALPEAVAMLRAMRGAMPDTPIALSAADPANPYGALLPACGISRDASNLIVIRGGRVVLGLSGRALTSFDLDHAGFGNALAALMKLRSKLVFETVDGESALASSRVELMAAIGFHSDGRALVYDGLPGPAPRRSQVVRVASN